MGYNYLNNVELDAALKLYLEAIAGVGLKLKVEEISVTGALGRVTAEAVYAKISSPHYFACAMDGIAVRAQDTFGATEMTPILLKEGAGFRWVDTGDPLPETADAVVMVEDVVLVGEGVIQLLNAATPWQHVRQIGEDICAGEMVLASNTRIEPAAMGALLAAGVTRLLVRQKPVVGLIPTGDELVAPSDQPPEGKIIEFNSAVFAAMLTEWGAIPRVYGMTPDNLSVITEKIKQASAECDLVIVNAGSSAGREDFSAKAIGTLGQVLVHGIAIRPGKPAILGLVDRSPGILPEQSPSCPVIGVPGYPVSGIIVLDQIIRPVIEMLNGAPLPPAPRIKASLARKVVSSLKYQEFVRVNIGYVGGRFVATPLNRGAGVITSFVKADGLLEIPINREGYESQSEVEVRLLRSATEIMNTMVVTGSHDQLIDIVSDLMRNRFPGRRLSSSHVGSMGGIMAIKRGEAHLAGIHLLDEATGAYNSSYITKYLPNENIAVIKGVKRLQGLMAAPGNPKNIQSIADIVRDRLQYVNRQKGSGTRILLDYLLKQNQISSDYIEGYGREEFTHLAVAALVASGSADAGLGVYAAAKIYHLDFIPICEEKYDFIIPEEYLEMEGVRCFIEILRSMEFRDALAKLGGYVLQDTGTVIRV